MPAMQTTFARVKEENLLSFLRLCSPHPGVIPSYPAAKRRPSTRGGSLDGTGVRSLSPPISARRRRKLFEERILRKF